MRVRLKTNVDVESSWLQRDKEYVVLEIDGALLRIYCDPGSHPQPLFPARNFDVTDDAIPPNWVVALHTDGDIRLAPRRWLEPGFVEALCDDESGENLTWWQHVERRNRAEAAWEEELAILLA